MYLVTCGASAVVQLRLRYGPGSFFIGMPPRRLQQAHSPLHALAPALSCALREHVRGLESKGMCEGGC